MFFKQELGWNATKVDELLSPVIQKMNRRRTNASGTASGVQGSLVRLGQCARRKQYGHWELGAAEERSFTLVDVCRRL